uniref:Uncharacterized protein LOC111131821 n=1 Tax=Crassostrea virginica TaxID=6565 RepID=A0A8B8E746_CRAVI|nr:uncharacterized protein LOC111131821 [Crassostrea virginica]
MVFIRILLIAAVVCALIQPTLVNSGRLDCPPGSANPQCSSAMVFDGFYNPGKKRPRRVSRQNSDSRNLKNDRKYENWPSFHPPLKTTKVQMPSTTVSIIAETTTGQIEQWLPIPPPIRKINIPNKDKRVTSTSFPIPTSSHIYPRQTQRNKSLPKISKDFQIPSIKHSRIQENDFSRLLGPFTTSLKKPDREIESTSVLPFTLKTNPTLPSTFQVIRIPKRVVSTSKQNREIKTLSDHFERETTLSFSSNNTLQISTLSNIKQEYLNQTTRQIARKSSHPAIFSTRTVILTTLNEKENHEENTRKEDIATTQSKKQTISSVLALSSTQTAWVEKETSLFQTPKNVAATQNMEPITKGITTTTPFHQTTLLETDSNPPRLSTIKAMTNGNLSDQTQVEEHLNSININCDQLSTTKTRQNKVLNITNRSLSYHTTTLSVKVKFLKREWTVSDNRASAVGIGSLGIVVIIAIIGGVICLDATTLFRDAKRIRKKFYRIFRPMKVNNKSANASRKVPKWAHFVTTRET